MKELQQEAQIEVREKELEAQRELSKDILMKAIFADLIFFEDGYRISKVLTEEREESDGNILICAEIHLSESDDTRFLDQVRCGIDNKNALSSIVDLDEALFFLGDKELMLIGSSHREDIAMLYAMEVEF